VSAEVSQLEDRVMMAADLLSFDGYDWSPNYRDNLAGTGWYSSGQQWVPQNATANASGLHLFLNTATIDNSTQLSSSEVSLVKKDGADKPLGFGTYLVAVHHEGGFNALANNPTVVFGAFLYQKDADSNDTLNPQHELDMIEASRFGPYDKGGWQGDPTNAQFTLQDFTKLPGHGGDLAPHDNLNVHRFILNDDQNITLVMHYDAAGMPVTFDQYYGIHDLAEVKRMKPAITWTSGTDGTTEQNTEQNMLIPGAGDQTVHFNLWRQPPMGDNDPNVHNDEVTIKRFQFEKVGTTHKR